MKGWARALCAIVMCIAVAGTASFAVAAPAPAPTTPVAVHTLPPAGTNAPPAPPAFDPERATNAYLATVSGKARAMSDSYFEGGYWLILWDALYAIGVSALLLWTKLSARIRNFAQARVRSRFWQVPIYVIAYVIVTTALTFPWSVYENFIREHQYGLSNQNFWQWFGDFGTGFGVNLVIFTIIATVIYAFVRLTKNYWWVWGTLVSIVFAAILFMLGPVFISPLFNHYAPLADGPVKQKILMLARANQIPADNVYEFDASRQSKRISANVSGFMGTTRISMTDNLLKRCSPAEIEAVLGHEMGHYVLDHNVIGLTWFSILFLVLFAFVNYGYRWLTGIFGGNWDVRTIDDPAGLPVAMALVSFFFLVATPVTNTMTRTLEQQADMFGLNAARQPDGFATVTLKLSEYRKLDPSPFEEFVFYDHPSGRTRIHSAMVWKAAHINDPDIAAGPKSPQ